MSSNHSTRRTWPHQRSDRHANGRQERAAPRSFIISNLPPLVTLADLRDFFNKFGDLQSINLLTDRHTNDLVGKANITFRRAPAQDFIHSRHFMQNYLLKVHEVREEEIMEAQLVSNTDDGSFPLKTLMMGAFMPQKTFVSECEIRCQRRPNNSPRITINFDKYRTHIFFNYMEHSFKVLLSLQSIGKKIALQRVGDDYFLTIHLRRAPKFWRKVEDVPKSSSLTWKSSGTWNRVTTIVPEATANRSTTVSSPLTPYSPGVRDINLGSWPVWRLLISFNSPGQADDFKRILQSFHFHNLVNLPIQHLTINVVNALGLPAPLALPPSLPFEVAYALESVLSLNYLYRRALTAEFLELVRSAPSHRVSKIVEKIWSEEETVLDPYAYFAAELDQPSVLNPRTELPLHSARMRKVIVTPTRVCVLPPVLETTNRIIRHFNSVQDRFLRVVFADEDLQPMHSNSDENHHLLKRIFNVMRMGLCIAGRDYSFLAFSSSQLREHSCWFFADCDEVKVIDIHKWMGDFSSIHNVAKYAARMGLCFSSSRDAAKLRVEDLQEIPDIERNGFCFTDGVGKISQTLLNNIAHELELPTVPSAIQFRMGGYKGMLAACPTLRDGQVQLRPSQRKFSSEHATLEVLRPAAFSTSHLNRQIITLLNSLGVPGEVFIVMQREMMMELKQMQNDAATASSALMKYSDEYGVSAGLIQLLESGFFTSRDNHVKNCLRLFFTYVLVELKTKARIQVPKGTLLLGVADELGVLKENEIFVQCTDPEHPNILTIVQGDCVVTRNPCFHPGDIRVVRAVDVPGLRHLTNVVVFPTVGARDIPSQCGGGDLDGDEFTVIWDQRLIPPNRNQEAMSYAGAKPKYVEQVSIDDIKRFFVDYIMNDCLGQIANAHLVRADISITGAMDPDCLTLAHLHSKAVDFPKTGVPAELEKELRASKFPDFMRKLDKPSYISEKCLGFLFRSLELTSFLPLEKNCDPRLLIEGYEEFALSAASLKLDYDAAISSLMNQYGIENELEIVTGYLLGHREMVKKSSFQVRRLVMSSMDEIRKKFRKEFESEFSKEGRLMLTAGTHKRMRQKASAWYFVSYDPDILKETKSSFNSFAWIVSDLLAEILAPQCKPEVANMTTRFNNIARQTPSKAAQGPPADTTTGCTNIAELEDVLTNLFL
ncbi:hypothetical protein DSO57_1021336 [Entomophthora muscae]|uniref:Uncharacterized protein n=1 Tax=Entomophthora muscae TaxID=34485 RepID=A0ACC2SSD7_9FUNG|nr:hypothetical protein DSO57_1021336 [Entomophthora muscae]